MTKDFFAMIEEGQSQPQTALHFSVEHIPSDGLAPPKLKKLQNQTRKFRLI
jgi:hypothetical protein